MYIYIYIYIYTYIYIHTQYTFVLPSSSAAQERQPEEQDPRERGARPLGAGKRSETKSGVSRTVAVVNDCKGAIELYPVGSMYGIYANKTGVY